jgi:hypothetical protein
MKASERRFQTRWGMLTGPEWILARQKHEMDRWWRGPVEAYVMEAWPSPEQIQENRRQAAEEREQERQERERDRCRRLKARAIADCARTDSGSRPRTPNQLSLI